MKNKRTIYLIVGIIVTIIAGYFISQRVREWVSSLVKGVVATKAVGKVTNVISDSVADKTPGRKLFGN